LATQEDLPIHSHMLETRLQREASLREHGKSPVKRFAELGLLGPRTSLAHMVWADAEDLDIVRDAGAAIVHNPASNLRLRSGVAPVSDMLERGIPVGIGMDGMSISDRGDFFQDLRLCGSLHFKPSGDAISSENVWQMLYAGGSKATFWGDQVGSLHPGANADAVVVELETSPMIAPVDPDWQLLDRVLREGSNDKVTSVVVGGRVIIEEGALKTTDEAALHDRIRAQTRRIEEVALKHHRALVARLEGAIVDYYEKWPRDRALNTTHLH
jgi:5-methylthioadenosine/S-adenosylhomocysteine deaminase